VINEITTGDARDLARQIPDESVDLVLTDPPFGIDYQYDGYEDNPEAYPDLVRWIVETSNRILKPGGLAFVFQAQLRLRLTWPLFPDDSRIFIAAKNFTQYRPTPVQFAYDPVVFWQKPGMPLIKPAAGARDYHVGNTANTGARGVERAGWHECPRPLDTVAYIVENFSPAGGLVCDFFMGSGTTAVAAKRLNRQFIGFELREAIAQKARARLDATQAMHPIFTGEAQAELFTEAV
jgi:site-specific DNA-methyltransferase (adenine-specific)